MKYSELAKTYEKLENNPSRLKKTEILSEFLNLLKQEENKEIIYLLQGRVFPSYNKTELGISSQLMKKAINRATGATEQEITKLWKEKGDLGTVAEQLIEKRKQKTLSSKKLTAEKVLENLKKLSQFEGKGTVGKKIMLIVELLMSSKPLEARYIARTVLHDLRIGVGDSTIRDAIVDVSFKNKDKQRKKQNTELIQDAYDKTTDFSKVFEKSIKGKKTLRQLGLEPGKPVKVMLFQKEESIEDGFKRVGKPALIEYKYDGFRMMITKSGKKDIKIFTRRLENVTKQFPEIKEYVDKYVKGKSFILDTEAVGYSPKTKKYLPFQEISQRIKRKYNIQELQKKLPIEVNVFDVLYHNGKSLLKIPLKKRRKLLEKIIINHKFKIKASEAIQTSDLLKAKRFYDTALKKREEGIMMKNLSSEYKPGSRVGYGIKIKPSESDFDLVITGGEYGNGKRAGWITSFDVSCKSGDKFLEAGKVSTGLKEKSSQGLSYKQMTKKLKKIQTKSKGKHIEVKPKIVVTVTYQNIQKSPHYSSGFALRFPRFTQLRPDRNPDDIATSEEIKKEYKK